MTDWLWKKRLTATLCIALLSIALNACASNEIRWTEEVKLSDGRVIELQRRVELTESGFPVQRRGFAKHYEICYQPMGIQWKSRRGYLPDVFDIVDGKAYMHVPIYDCASCMFFGYPETDSLYFVWDNGKWKRIGQDEFPSQSEWNLLMSFVSAPGHEKDDPRGLVTLEEKERRPSSLRTDQQRRGWKRVNEGGKGVGRCKACRQIETTTTAKPEVFVNEGGNTCKPN